MSSGASTWTRYLVPLGRVAFAAVFVVFAPANFSPQGIAWGAEFQWRNSRLITGDIVGQITKLKQQPGKNITTLGSATLVRSLLRQGLLDQLGLLIYPVVLGTGKRLFEEWTGQVPLKLVQSRALSNGVLSLTYELSGK